MNNQALFWVLLSLCAILALLATILFFVLRRQHPKCRCCGCPVPGPTGDQGPPGTDGATGPAGADGLATGAGIVMFNSNVVNISDGNLIGFGYITTAVNEFMASYILTRDCTLQNLYVNLSTIPGGGNGRLFTLRLNGADTPLSVVVANFATSASDTITTVPALAGDRVSLQTTNIGSPMPSTCEASFQYL